MASGFPEEFGDNPNVLIIPFAFFFYNAPVPLTAKQSDYITLPSPCLTAVGIKGHTFFQKAFLCPCDQHQNSVEL